jgi:hypothetical protein
MGSGSIWPGKMRLWGGANLQQLHCTVVAWYKYTVVVAAAAALVAAGGVSVPTAI